MRLSVRPWVRIKYSPPDFHGPSRMHQTLQDVKCSTSQCDPISRQTDSRVICVVSPFRRTEKEAVKKKRELFLEYALASPGSFMLPYNIHVMVREF